MQDGAPPPEARSQADLRDRLAAAGTLLGAREATHRAGLDEAQQRCDALRALVLDALDGVPRRRGRAPARRTCAST